MPEKNEKQLEFVELVSGWKCRRTVEERVCGKDEFRAWSGRENE